MPRAGAGARAGARPVPVPVRVQELGIDRAHQHCTAPALNWHRHRTGTDSGSLYNSRVRSIAILGAGELGGALARQLAAADVVQRIVLIDEAGTVAEGKALDIRQAAPVDCYSTVVAGTNDDSAAIGADAIVIADRAATSGDAGAEWHGDAGLSLVRRLAGLNQGALLLCAGARQAEVVERGVREAAISRQRLFGSAPEALRSAVVSMTALEAACTPA